MLSESCSYTRISYMDVCVHDTFLDREERRSFMNQNSTNPLLPPACCKQNQYQVEVDTERVQISVYVQISRYTCIFTYLQWMDDQILTLIMAIISCLAESEIFLLQSHPLQFYILLMGDLNIIAKNFLRLLFYYEY